jgi:hypothetical protein
MTTLIIIIAIVVFYILPAYSVWRYLHLAHSKGGIYESTSLAAPDFMIVIIPGVNWIASVDLWNSRHPLKSERGRKPRFLYWFFNIK